MGCILLILVKNVKLNKVSKGLVIKCIINCIFIVWDVIIKTLHWSHMLNQNYFKNARNCIKLPEIVLMICIISHLQTVYNDKCTLSMMFLKYIFVWLCLN